MRLVDLHCHLDLYPDFEAMVSECDRLGIFTLAVTTTPKAWSRNHKLASSTKFVRAALGLHPQLVAERWKEIELWERLLDQTRYVGEVGLDAGPRYHSSLGRQTEVFRHILQCCARAGGKILSIHSVRSASKVLDLIEEEASDGRTRFVFHWFTGSVAEARRATELGCYFSVNAEMLSKERARAVVATIPDDRLLTETDGPFTWNGQISARPKDVGAALSLLGKMRGLPETRCAELVFQNFKALTAH
ncbi:TatD family hydrolase [Rhodopseudomonas palustris]|uniref:Qat anti-phage system TatD family nuclease QatD n=1 Tax=Rhodopseudomonas palustris TaxID=1076 RepID=UPI0020CF6F5E|nr:Qat anti-phage system TatD family nuclease QatD [Rhodopseudomonas palustris]MCP9630756.1 TatD family hydrolase [Rhodopseudomonas palustris]